jgi:sulfur transfer complex TusBCD TusB component (DsrH family)
MGAKINEEQLLIQEGLVAVLIENFSAISSSKMEKIIFVESIVFFLKRDIMVRNIYVDDKESSYLLD